tara:strand:- start:565 stop:717 length:153 start_codon:yes stop_codon:yes gene_type:complete
VGELEVIVDEKLNPFLVIPSLTPLFMQSIMRRGGAWILAKAEVSQGLARQ